MFGSLDISTSALVAQRQRLTAITANMANSHAVEDAKGNYAPYQRRHVVFAQGDGRGNENGVHVKEILQMPAFRQVHEPDHKFANEDGYVMYPDIDPAVEQINAMEASRAYEANIVAAEATKSMMQSALRLLA